MFSVVLSCVIDRPVVTSRCFTIYERVYVARSVFFIVFFFLFCNAA